MEILDIVKIEPSEELLPDTVWNEEELLKCEHCSRNFKYISHLERHLAVRSGKRSLVCPLCKTIFAAVCIFKAHLKTHHVGQHKTNCHFCKETPTKDRNSKNKRYNIKGYLTNDAEQPIKIVKRNTKKKTGKQKSNVRPKTHRHECPDKSETKFYTCKYCEKSLATKYTFQEHVKLHTGDRPHVCGDCGRSFTSLRTLKKHSRYHIKIKPYPCKICQKSFPTEGRFEEHYRVHTGEKPFTCKHCGKAFATSSTLRDHARTHTGEKPFMCKLCDSSFITTTRLNEHYRLHTGELYSCEFCEKSFTNKTALKIHGVVHSGERPYSCHFCQRTFTVKSNLRAHLTLAHDAKTSRKN